MLINFDKGLIISSSKGACMIGSTAQIMTCWTMLTKKLIDDKVVTEEEIREDFELVFKSMDELKSMALDKLINLKEKLDKKFKKRKENSMRKKAEEKKEFNLDEAFVLWLKTSKDKKEYLSGHDLNNNKIVGFFNTNKRNEKEPDIELYQVDEKGNKGDKVVSLWENKSKEGRVYLSGTTNENEKIVAFYGDKKEEKRPYVKGYFKEN